jgi:hypothetical protein
VGATGVANDVVHIGQVIRNAVAFDFKNLEPGVNGDALLEAVNRMFALLEERRVDYLLVGGIAMLRYVEGRNTEDVDLIMTVSDLDRLPELEVVGSDADFVRCKFGDLSIDLLLTRNPLFNQVRRQYATVGRFVEREIPCATVEGLLVLKLYALPSLYRQGNFARVGLYENDVATLMQAYRPPLEPLFAELTGHLSPDDLAVVREIVAEIEQRVERFRRGSDTGG